MKTLHLIFALALCSTVTMINPRTLLAAEQENMAALPFRLQEGIDKDLVDVFVDKLVNVMHQVGDYKVLNHTDITVLRQQQMLAETTCNVDQGEDCDQIMGVKLGADYYLQGSARLVGPNYFFSVKINAVSTGEVRSASDIVVDPKQPASVLTSAELLAHRLLGIPEPKKPSPKQEEIAKVKELGEEPGSQTDQKSDTKPEPKEKQQQKASHSEADQENQAEKPYRYPGGFIMHVNAPTGAIGVGEVGLDAGIGWDDRWGRIGVVYSMTSDPGGALSDIMVYYGWALSVRRFAKSPKTFDFKVIPAVEVGAVAMPSFTYGTFGVSLTLEYHIGHTFYFSQRFRYASGEPHRIAPFGIGLKF